MPDKIEKETEARNCIYCGQDYLESASDADDKESYCTKTHENFDAYVNEVSDDDDSDELLNDEDEDEEEEEELG